MLIQIFFCLLKWMLSPYQNCPISIYFTYYLFKDLQENDENINNTKISFSFEIL